MNRLFLFKQISMFLNDCVFQFKKNPWTSLTKHLETLEHV